MKKRAAKSPAKVLLNLAASTQETQAAFVAWFRRARVESWKNALPTAVIVPTRGQANSFKALLLARGKSHLGVHFLTPNNLVPFLADNDLPSPPAPEHLRLLLGIAARELEKSPNEAEALAAKAVARSPALLLRALHRLHSAGWDFDQLPISSFRPIVRRFHELLRQCGFVLPAEAERHRFQQAKKSEPRFADLFVAGFDGAHWPRWFLLRAAVDAALEATIVLEEPREDFADIDLCWIGSWEEAFGEARRASGPASALHDSLFSEEEMRGAARPASQTDFLIGANLSEQAEAIALQCLRYLPSPKCTRLAVIFPGAGALPRLVAERLAALKIPHHDSLGHSVPGIFETAEWQAWLELQRTMRLNGFLKFLNALPDTAVLGSEISPHALEKILRESFDEILLDDLEVLREFCALSSHENVRGVAQLLREFPFLPERGTIANFLAATHEALGRLGWHQRSIELRNFSSDWPPDFRIEIPRALYLRWLDEAAALHGVARAESGDHPYARVRLLTIAHAQNQSWSHLIVAGCNEGQWPPPPVAEFARDAEIRAFNRSIQILNRRAVSEGRQGEGHSSVRENHALYLGPSEQRAIALRQFAALLENVEQSVTLTASLVQEDAPERPWNPSECFTQLFFQTRREPLTQVTLKQLQRSTAKWIRESRSVSENIGPLSADIRQTLHAFDARRDASKPAGEFDFALRPNESFRSAPKLSVSDLERMLKSPAIVWLKHYLGVEERETTANAWSAATGKWVHRWLAKIAAPEEGKLFAPFPQPTTIDERICFSADAKHEELRSLCHSLGRALPEWWSSAWLHALYLARHFGAKIAAVEDWPWLATELSIAAERAVKIADDIHLQLRGRIDLVLAKSETANFEAQKIWIVDYKTSSAKPLTASGLHDQLVRGTALQLGLYALAARARGATEVDASIVSLAVKDVKTQITDSDLAPHHDVFAALSEMQQTGIFGMKGELRPGFGFGPAYPLATLPIDEDILEDKWARTHEALVLEREAGEW